MPLIVSCRCGQRFAANEQLIGQQVPCPACGNLLAIGGDLAAPQSIVVSCACGRSFSAPASLAGRQTRCPACGGPLHVPGTADPFVGGFPDLDDSLDHAVPVPPRDGEIPWDTLKRIGKIGGIVLLLVVIGMSIMHAMRRRPVIAETQPTVLTPAPSKTGNAFPSTPRPQPLPPPPPAAPEESSTEATVEKSAIPITSEKTATAKLPQSVQDWYTQPSGKLAGIRRANPTDPPIVHFSWLTGLLPFLGHQKTYDRFDFQATLEENRNIQVGATIIPEFLNPLEDRQRWRGYPFDGIALSHFVGISGVEDSRNVVAAKLPRTDPRAGIFGYDEVARPDDIIDGKSQTIMVAGAGELPNPWVFGGGATIRGAREPLFDKTSGSFGTKGLDGGGTIVMMADGSVRRVSANIDPRVFKAMCTIRGSDSVDLERDSQPFDLHSLHEAKK